MLLDHHVDSFLSILQVELVELLSLSALALGLILLVHTFTIPTTESLSFVSLRTTTKYFLSQRHIGIIFSGLVQTTESITIL
jgi:hypothetical protein